MDTDLFTVHFLVKNHASFLPAMLVSYAQAHETTKVVSDFLSQAKNSWFKLVAMRGPIIMSRPDFIVSELGELSGPNNHYIPESIIPESLQVRLIVLGCLATHVSRYRLAGKEDESGIYKLLGNVIKRAKNHQIADDITFSVGATLLNVIVSECIENATLSSGEIELSMEVLEPIFTKFCRSLSQFQQQYVVNDSLFNWFIAHTNPPRYRMKW